MSRFVLFENNELLTEGGEEEKRRIFNLFLNQEIENHQLSLDKYADYFDYCNLKQLSELIIAYHKSTNFSWMISRRFRSSCILPF